MATRGVTVSTVRKEARCFTVRASRDVLDATLVEPMRGELGPHGCAKIARLPRSLRDVRRELLRDVVSDLEAAHADARTNRGEVELALFERRVNDTQDDPTPPRVHGCYHSRLRIGEQYRDAICRAHAHGSLRLLRHERVRFLLRDRGYVA